MSRTTDLVVVGLTAAGRQAAIDAARRGWRVLVVDASTERRGRQWLSRQGDQASERGGRRVSIVGGMEVVCIDGGDEVEAVLLRRIRTGRLVGVNTRAVLLTTPLSPGRAGARTWTGAEDPGPPSDAA